MKIYFAPMEGITGYIFRNIFDEFYGPVDKYFAPFIAPEENKPLTPRDRKELAPENNSRINLVPQILACRSDHFIEASEVLVSMGYKEVNLNLGCPSGTVCAKGKGAGFLPETLALSKFLEDIYSWSASKSVRISIKTRLGYYDPDEFYDLVEIFNGFPVSELIVHPRIRGDFYKGDIRREYYKYAQEHARFPLVYNGNINSTGDYDDLCDYLGRKPDLVMIGRGLIADPDLAARLLGEGRDQDHARFRKFHDALYHEYQKVMSPDINVLYKMKELWAYWRYLFEDHDRDIRRLLKAKKYKEYEDVVYGKIFSDDN